MLFILYKFEQWLHVFIGYLLIIIVMGSNWFHYEVRQLSEVDFRNS